METVTSNDGFTVTSSDESAEDMRVALAPEGDESPEPTPEPEPKPAAKTAATEKPSTDKRTREGKKASIQQEIDELVGTKHHTQREVEAARSELQRLQSELAQVNQQRQPRESAPGVPDKFPTYEQLLASHPDLTPEGWLDARDEWRDAKKADTEARRTSEVAHRTRIQTFDGKIRAAETAEPGFWQSVNAFAASLVPAKELKPGQSVTGSNAIADVILDSDNPDKLLKHFRDNPTDLQRISTLHPVLAFREMGKLEARLEAAHLTGPASAASASYSRATPPLKPVSGSPTISDNEASEEDLPFDQFVKHREAQIRRVR